MTSDHWDGRYFSVKVSAIFHPRFQRFFNAFSNVLRQPRGQLETKLISN
jgi:hypothetical protein